MFLIDIRLLEKNNLRIISIQGRSVGKLILGIFDSELEAFKQVFKSSR